ncbi:hypothetical protein BC941DRAFT_466043 [Chlamydoabsidia padenii]|nr:hypothetical protein BC941DRAFT_466043 [Chlamydoabsidia padenii]
MTFHHSNRIQNIAFLSLGIINAIVYILVFAASIIKAIDGKLGEIIQAIYCCLELWYIGLQRSSSSPRYQCQV